MESNTREINKEILRILTQDPYLPLKGEEIFIKNENILIKTDKAERLEKYFEMFYNHQVSISNRYTQEYITIHPEILPEYLYKKYIKLIERNPEEEKIYKKLINLLKNFPYYSIEDKELIIFFLISGNKFSKKNKDRLFEDLIKNFPEISERIKSHKTVDSWVKSINPEPERLELSLLGLFFIITELIDEEYNIESEKSTRKIYIEEGLKEKIEKIWDTKSPEIITKNQIIYKKSFPRIKEN